MPGANGRGSEPGAGRRPKPCRLDVPGMTMPAQNAVAVVVGTPAGPRTGAAAISIKDGALFYESGTSSGSVTLHDKGVGACSSTTP